MVLDLILAFLETIINFIFGLFQRHEKLKTHYQQESKNTSESRKVFEIQHNPVLNFGKFGRRVIEGFKQMKQVRELLGVPKYHSAGYDGRRSTIAILDEGVKPTKWGTGILNLKHDTRQTGAHGNHVYGIINNICPKSTFISYQIVGRGCHGNAIGTALYDCYATNEADVVNMSLACDLEYGKKDKLKYYFGDRYLDIHEIYEKLQSKGIIVVLAAGNSKSGVEFKEKISLLTQKSDSERYVYGKPMPAQTVSTWPIVVSSCTLDGEMSCFNTINKTIKCMSFGDRILSYPYEEGYSAYVQMSGTSMAAPQVTGCIGLLIDYTKATHPEMSKIERATFVRNFFLHSCTVRTPTMLKTIAGVPHELQVINMIVKTGSSAALYKIKAMFKDLVCFTSNSQFTGVDPESITRENCNEIYRKFYGALLHKYGILSVGYGIVKLPDFFPRVVDDMKPQFDLSECYEL